jgi:RND family efflux transporter MFP subunit
MEPAPKFEQALHLQGHSRRKLLIRWLVITAVLLGAAITGYVYFTKPAQVAAARPIRGPAAEVVYGTGFVEPRRPVEVSSRVTAPVTQVLADEGDHVARGQPLAVLDAEDQRETIAQLTASRINAEQDERRAIALFKQGWSTNAVRDKAVAAANSARALEAAGRARLNQFTIRSQTAGVILRRDVEPGDLATPSKTLFQLGNAADLRVTAIVDERDIPMVRNGAEALMSTDAYPGRVIRGRVYEITPGGDPDQRAFRVRIRPDSIRDLPIGLTLEVNILVSSKKSALLVPASAVRKGVVWTIDDGHARPVRVKTGIRGADTTEVTAGLPANACVVTDPADGIKDGQRVKATGC